MHRSQPRQHQPRQQQNVKVTTNSFEISSLPVKEYTQYDANHPKVFTPEVTIPRKRQEIIHKLQTVVAPEIFSPRAVYDGNVLLYASKPLKLTAEGTGNFSVSLTAVSPQSAATYTRGVYNVKLTETIGESVRTSDMTRLINGRQSDSKTLTATNLLQLLIRQEPNQKYVNNGRAYFTPQGSRPIGSGLELWRGFFQSVRPAIGRMLVNIDTSVAAVYAGGNLIDVCLDFLGKNDVRALALDEKSPNFRALQKHLKDLQINTLTTRKRVRTIHGLVPAAGTYIFPKDDREISVQEHFKAAHNITIKYPNIIGVRLSSKKSGSPVVVPAEACTVLPGQLYKKKIPDHLTKAMVDFATVKPADRLRQITSGYANSEFLVEAGMVIDTRPISVTGKILETPVLWYGHQNQVTPHEGAWNLRGVKLQSPAGMECWGVVNFCSSIRAGQVEQYMKSMADGCRILGMNTKPPIDIIQGLGSAVERVRISLDGLLNKALTHGYARGKMIVIVILPARAPALRTRVKHWGDIITGTRTQCLCEEKVKRANDQYWGNVGLKLNARLGGHNSVTQSAVIDELMKEPFMIMGADVGHAGPGILKPSVTSLVWSYDRFATQYAAFTGLQNPRVETIEGLRDMFKRAVISFGMRNNPPGRIVFFRDGVSEGEFDHVLKVELGAMRAAIDDVWKEKEVQRPKPKLTFIVVGKNTRDRTGNCRAGFVADEGISHPVTLDFYLQSHAAVKGTSRSSHYSVLVDEIFQNDLAKLQQLAFALCHVYAKATRSVSIPAPVYCRLPPLVSVIMTDKQH
ncbi:Protein argonaute-3 [Termitomyces sp. J132]|nr:Protein argonaute-3 [Termitomyces sp. J132]